MADPFENHATKLESPPRNAMDVTPSDTVDLPIIPRALHCTGTGVVRVTLVGVGTVTLPLVFGVPLSGHFRRVWATGTTATGIVAVW